MTTSRKRACTVGALLLGLYHVFIALPFVTGEVTGEASMYMLVLDLPLALLAAVMPGGLYGHSQTFWKSYLGIGGTLMYAAGGAFLGYLFDRIRSRFF